MSEPIMSYVQCQKCFHNWNGFFPEGLSGDFHDTPVECPKCGEMCGMLIPHQKGEVR